MEDKIKILTKILEGRGFDTKISIELDKTGGYWVCDNKYPQDSLSEGINIAICDMIKNHRSDEEEEVILEIEKLLPENEYLNIHLQEDTINPTKFKLGLCCHENEGKYEVDESTDNNILSALTDFLGKINK